jgi:hypothetical protein
MLLLSSFVPSEAVFFLHTLHFPPSLQWAQAVQFLQALQSAEPVHFAASGVVTQSVPSLAECCALLENAHKQKKTSTDVIRRLLFIGSQRV